jgi:hypothetical protein
MRDFIFFAARLIRIIDPSLLESTYRHNGWFNLSDSLARAAHFNSRVTKLNTPWPLAPSINPIPDITENELRFDIVLNGISEEICQHAIQKNKPVYLCWSGGIDSTAILTSFLQVGSQEFLKNLTVVLDNTSINENSYFYYHYIHDRIKTLDTSIFEITKDNHDKIIVIDGEGGNQCLQGPSVQGLIYRKQFELLNQPWNKQTDLKNLLNGSNNFQIELILESIRHAPISIDTVYDFLWWTGFNFKFDDVMIRKMFAYSQNLTPNQTEYFWNNSLIRPFGHDRMQMWSMNARDLRRHYCSTTVKYFAKKYIFDFDQNDFWYSSKTEQASDAIKLKTSHSVLYLPYFAFDTGWNKYSIADCSTRQLLGKLLEKT